MRILLVNSFSGVGGAETHVAQLTLGLVARGHEVHVASPAEGPLVAATIDAGGRHHPAPMFPDRPSVAQILRLCAIMGAVTPDVVHLHGTRAGLLGRLALLPERSWRLRRSRGPATGRPAVVYTVHGAHFLHYPPPQDRVWAGVERLLEKLTTDETIFVCRADLVDCFAVGATAGRRCAVVYNGVASTTRPDHSEDGLTVRRAVRGSLGLDDDATLLLAVGRLSNQKDYPTMLWAIAGAREDLTSARATVVIVGDGPERKNLHNLAAELDLGPELVMFLGTRTDVPRLMEAADALVMSSAWEGLPYVALEAMTFGLPIVATDVSGLPEAVRGGESGLLVAPRDPLALSRALGSIARDPALRAKMGRAGSARLTARFNVETMVRDTEEVYRRACGVASARTPSESGGQ